jgi:hypothetical protein
MRVSNNGRVNGVDHNVRYNWRLREIWCFPSHPCGLEDLISLHETELPRLQMSVSVHALGE